MSVRGRLSKLEREMDPAPPESAHEREHKREQIRRTAEHANNCRLPESPRFEVADNGDVFCTHDGRPVTELGQTLAEEFYWMEVSWGGAGLVHDEEAQAFYTPDGELAVSRDRADLQNLMGPGRREQ